MEKKERKEKKEISKFKDPCYIAVEGGIPLKRQRECIIDCDPGADDLHGIILGCYMNNLEKDKSKRTRIVGITTVNGNTGVDNGTINAALGLEVLASEGLLEEQVTPIQVY